MTTDSRKPPLSNTPDTAETAGNAQNLAKNNSGRIKHDDRGNAIWEWAATTGAVALETSTQSLRKLDNPSLSLLDDSRPANTLVKENPRGAVQGYSPYDSGLLVKKEPPRKKDLRRLSEWLKLKKQAENRSPDDE